MRKVGLDLSDKTKAALQENVAKRGVPNLLGNSKSKI
jgi:hypothetical protein